MNDLKLYGRNEKRLDSLIQSVRVVSEENVYGIRNVKVCNPDYEKGNVIQSEGITLQSEGITLPGDKVIRSLNSDDKEGYKYLRVLEADDIKHGEMKEKIQKE